VYLISFFTHFLLENFQKLHYDWGFPEFLNLKKMHSLNSQGEFGGRILEKLQDSANSQSKFHSAQKIKSLLPKNLTIYCWRNFLHSETLRPGVRDGVFGSFYG
jgi:hypothetical protein